jgi:alkylation response protein AidB-like acyl-CoA dehydrogenase
MSDAAPALPAYMVALTPILNDVVAPAAAEVDRTGSYPRAALDTLGAAGLLGLISAADVGGQGEGPRAATAVVQALAEHCGSTAMVVMMHYAGTAVIEAFGPTDVRERIAAGEYVTTLAFSEVGSRSMFWAPMSSAVVAGEGVRLDAEKSWVTSAGEADGYVWSSRPLAATPAQAPANDTGASTLWLVPKDAAGLKVGAPFDGLGLRGNSSSPMSATGVEVPASAMLAADGGGFDAMLGVVLPWFQVMSAGFSIGTANVATGKAALHAVGTRFEHLDQAVADNPVARANVARMRIRTDAAEALLLDTLTAMETARADATLRVLEVKAHASETAIDVTDLAMRVCGGAAFRKELGVERNFRDARAASVMAPTTDALYDFIGRIACGLPLF